MAKREQGHKMNINIEEISSIIKGQIEDYDKRVAVTETGTVISVGDGIARIYGLEKAMAGEGKEVDAAKFVAYMDNANPLSPAFKK